MVGGQAMIEDTWSKPGGALAVLARVRLEPQAAALLTAQHTPAQFVALLVEHGHAADAARFAAFALPRRRAVGWACRCVRQTLAPEAPGWAAIQAAQRWASEPTEENRRSALAAAEGAGFGTAAGCCAAAAFWSGGSMAPAGLPLVPPAGHLLTGA